MSVGRAHMLSRIRGAGLPQHNLGNLPVEIFGQSLEELRVAVRVRGLKFYLHGVRDDGRRVLRYGAHGTKQYLPLFF